MAKQFFSNLPNTTTPVEASRLNGLLDGEEAMGNLVVDSIRSKNMFDASTIVAGDITGDATTIRLSSRQALWLDTGTYTFSCNITSPFRYSVDVQNVGVPPLSDYPTYISSSNWRTASNPTYTFTLSTAGWVIINVSKENNATLTLSDISGFHFMLEKGDTATTYAPYEYIDDTETYTLTNLPSVSGATHSYLLKRDNRTVVFNCNMIWLSSLSANTWTNIGKIPQRVCPKGSNIQTVAVIVNGDTGNALGYGIFRIDTTGQIAVKSNVAYTGTFVAGICTTISWILN